MFTSHYCTLTRATNTDAQTSSKMSKPTRSTPSRNRKTRSTSSEPPTRSDRDRLGLALARLVVQMARVNGKIERINEAIRQETAYTCRTAVRLGARRKGSEDKSADVLLLACNMERHSISENRGKTQRPARRTISLGQQARIVGRLGRTMTALMRRKFPLTWQRMLHEV